MMGQFVESSDSPLLFCFCGRVLKFTYWSTGLLLTLPRTSGGLSFSLWSAAHCSDWRKGSLGAGLEVLPCSEKRNFQQIYIQKRQDLFYFWQMSWQNRCSLGLHWYGICLELLSEPHKLTVPPPHAWDLLGKTHAGRLKQKITVIRWVGCKQAFCSFYLRVNKFRSLCKHARSRSSVSAGLAPRCWWPAAWMEKSEEPLNWLLKKGKFILRTNGSRWMVGKPH